jgi:hypothetical protein
MARPKAKIDEREVELLARAGCSDHTIAHALGVNERTIQRRFAARIKEWREGAIACMKRRLYDRALDDNRRDSTTNLIFWLKNYGGMRDQVGISNPDGNAVEVKSVRVDL